MNIDRTFRIFNDFQRAYRKWLDTNYHEFRDLYDFFDSFGIFINVERKATRFIASIYQPDQTTGTHTDVPSVYTEFKSRKIAEENAFEIAFGILENILIAKED